MTLVIETERLQLRELHVGDAAHFYALNSNTNVLKYTGDTAFESVLEAEHFLRNYHEYEVNGYGRWAVLDKFSGEFLGWCGLKYVAEVDETDIGFRFFENHWNKGFATESARACLHYGFEQLNLKSIIGRAMAENRASIKVLEKLGMHFEKEFDFENHRGLFYRIENIKHL